MISLESQVLQRHLSFFEDKTVILSGNITDLFFQHIDAVARSVKLWSCYFDYAKDKSAVDFDVIFEQQADLLVYYWGKNKQEAQFQLMQLLSNAYDDQQMLIIGENRAGVRSIENMLAPYGEIAKIDSARRCGLYHFRLQNKPHFALADYWKSYQHPSLDNLIIQSLPGVFSANELDVGTSLLLSTISNNLRGKVLDIGCGAGVIGAMIKQKNPKVDLLMTDIHAMALASATKTLQTNQLAAEVRASDVFSHIGVQEKFDLIISNPPFHDGIDTAYQAVTKLIEQAKWHLTAGGELRIVANAFLPYPDLLDRYFGSHQVLAKTNKFKVYSCVL